MMMDRVVRFFITLFLAIAGGALLHLATPLLTELISTEIFKVDMGLFKITATSLLCIILGAVLGGIIGFIISPYLINKLKKFSLWVETALSRMPVHDVVAGAIGLVVGLIIASLLGYTFGKIRGR